MTARQETALEGEALDRIIAAHSGHATVDDLRELAAWRERVEEAIRELGYVPSAVARSLKSNTTRTVGMLIPNSSNPYFAEIVRVVSSTVFNPLASKVPQPVTFAVVPTPDDSSDVCAAAGDASPRVH